MRAIRFVWLLVAAAAPASTWLSTGSPVPSVAGGQDLPLAIDLAGVMNPWIQAGLLALATLVSEDLTCIAAGVLIASGSLPWIAGLGGCAAGIYAGDLALWLAGRLFGAHLARRGWLPARSSRVERLAAAFDRHAPAAILASRFVPGTRLPLYLGLGALGRRPAAFALCTLAAVVLWTPLVVGLAAIGGHAVVLRARTWAGYPLLLAFALGIGFVSVRRLERVPFSIPRLRLPARLDRWRRWEFWPLWLFYLPVFGWIAWLVLRYRSLTLFTAVNPGMPLGGFVGESKSAILDRLPPEWTAAHFVIEPGARAVRRSRLVSGLLERGWTWPVVLKPDVGERGSGVRIVRSLENAARALGEMPERLIVQACHPGPHEAGIFYYRMPGEARGRIFSITHKVFPEVEGDGASTLRALILAHPRYRLQSAVFFDRHRRRLDLVVPRGQRVALALAGNHCQGTMFCDGGHLLTPALEARIDAIARRVEGFDLGRFDVRYADEAAFMAGDDLTIVELNGVSSESTNIYDPRFSLADAYRTLFRQWSIVFGIGAANRQRGIRPAPPGQVIRAIRTHRRRRVPVISD